MYSKMLKPKAVLGLYPSLIYNSCCKRMFYISCCSFVRRKRNEKRTISEELPELGEKQVESEVRALANHRNFYGIESDEGVIFPNQNFSSLNPEHKVDNTVPQRKSTENFYMTSFGLVRRDGENSVKYHGQYDVELDERTVRKSIGTSLFDFVVKPSHSSEQVKKPSADIYHQSDLNSIVHLENNICKDDFQRGSHSAVLNDSKIDVETENVNSNNINFFDENYFHDILENKEKMNSEYNIPSSVDEKYTKSNIDSYSTESLIKNMSVTENTIHSSEKVDSDFFDEQYFQSSVLNKPNIFNEEKNYLSSASEISHSHGEANNQYDNATGIKFNKHEKNSEYNFNSDRKFIEFSSFPHDAETDSSFKLKDTSVQNSTNKNFAFHSSVADTTNNEAFSAEYPLNVKRNSLYPDKQISPEKECDKSNSSNLKSKFKNADYFSKKLESHTNRSTYTVSNELADSNIRKDISSSNSSYKESKGKTCQSTLGAQDEKFKEVVISQESEVKTAHDFAMKIRAEKKLSQSVVQGGKLLTPGINLDSKGFRILKNQVPNFSCCTNDEIIEILLNSILYSDDNLIVLNKPYNLVIHDSQTTKDPCLSPLLDSLALKLDKTNSSPKLFTVHRLDKETTGCLLLARNELMAQTLKSYFAQRKILKTYWIITSNVPEPLEGIIDIPISEGFIEKKSRMVLHPDIPDDVNYKNHSKVGKRAVTKYKVLSVSGNAALVEVKPETGITHQIRVHFGFGLSCPILGDHKYSHLKKLAPQKLASDVLQKLQVRQSKVRYIPMHIHAQNIVIPEYLDGRNLYVSAPLPDHMKKNMKTLKFRR